MAVALLTIGSPLAAQVDRCRIPEKIAVPTVRPDGARRTMPVTGYTLALSWSPEFCRSRGRSSGHIDQCSGRNGRFGFVVHGLWPEGSRGWPQWCPTGQRLSSGEAQRNFCMMPSARLQATEWMKHGSCMTRRPETYFKVTRILFGALRLPELSKASRLTAGALRRSFLAANAGWQVDAVGIELSRGGWLEEIRLCYDDRFRPVACGRARLGARDGAPVRIWRGSSAAP